MGGPLGEGAQGPVNGRDRLIFALDVPSSREALAWADRLGGVVGAYKVGLELFVSEGPALVRELAGRGLRVFLDLKFHDIPATMAGAARAAGRLGTFLVNVHALAGSEGMARAADAARMGAREAGLPAPKVLAVTLLTSHGSDDLRALGLQGSPGESVRRLAELARSAGLEGVVCSPAEAAALRRFWAEALIVTPGVRPAGAAADDQVRVATPAGARRAGADYVVVGRPIRTASDPEAAAASVVRELETC